MATVIIVVVVAVVAALIATAINGRRPDAPTAPRFAVPQQLDRDDFDDPSTQWLLALFSSETCLSCLDARNVLEPVSFDSLTVQDITLEDFRSTHDRYGIDAVPTVVLADQSGVVRWSFLGVPPEAALRDALVDAGIITPGGETSVSLP